MKITIIISLIITLSPLITNFVNAHGNHDSNIEDVIKELARKQGVSNPTDLNCGSLSDSDLERLGEAVMSYMHPDPKVHEAMDDMMGGEGSESLKLAHINMAKSYLGCEGNRWPQGMGMMFGLGGPSAGGLTKRNLNIPNNYSSNYPMMGWGVGFVPMFLSLSIGISLLVLMILGIVYLFKKINNGK